MPGRIFDIVRIDRAMRFELRAAVLIPARIVESDARAARAGEHIRERASPGGRTLPLTPQCGHSGIGCRPVQDFPRLRIRTLRPGRQCDQTERQESDANRHGVLAAKVAQVFLPVVVDARAPEQRHSCETMDQRLGIMPGDNHKPRIGLLLGDPAGIGPEVAARLLSLPRTLAEAEILVIGDRRVHRRGFEIAGVPEVAVPFLDYSAGDPDYPMGMVSAAAGEYVLGSLRLAIETLQRGVVDAVVYAPLNKQAMKLAGLAYEDELHYFASLLGYSDAVSEINVCGRLWTTRVTSHVPLAVVAGLITMEKICSAAILLHRALVSSGVAAPRIAIAALNPHAGEGGLLGTEERTTIGPAVERLRADGVSVSGPLSADTVFVTAGRGDFDGVVTMYHDQGQIALKLLGFHRGVTVSGGLPVVITTPAHGTAFDIAGRGIADAGAMTEAFSIACKMAACCQDPGRLR